MNFLFQCCFTTTSTVFQSKHKPFTVQLGTLGYLKRTQHWIAHRHLELVFACTNHTTVMTTINSKSDRYCVSRNLVRLSVALESFSLMWVDENHKQKHSFQNIGRTQLHFTTHWCKCIYKWINGCQHNKSVFVVRRRRRRKKKFVVCVLFVYIIQDLVDCVNWNPLNSIVIIIDAVFGCQFWRDLPAFVKIENQ